MQLTKKNREKFKEELVRTNMNMIPVLWTIDPLDWCSSNVECITDSEFVILAILDVSFERRKKFAQNGSKLSTVAEKMLE